MKASKFFIILVGLVIFGSISNVAAQINTAFSGNGTPTTTINGVGNNAFGAGALSSITTGNQNVAIGNLSLNLGTLTSRNVAVGFESLRNSVTIGINTGGENTAIGHASSFWNSTGSNNVAVGRASLFNNLIGNNNVAIGHSSGSNSTGSNNTFVGLLSASNLSSGDNNTIIGSLSAQALLSGSGNTIIGRAGGFNRLATNPLLRTIILADGGVGGSNGTQRLYIDNNGNAGFGLGNFIVPKNRLDIAGGVAIGQIFGAGFASLPSPEGTVAPTSGLIVQGNTGIGTSAPSNRLEVFGGVLGAPYNPAAGTSGLTFSNLRSTNSNVIPTSGKVLTVNNSGEVVLTNDSLGGITNSCTTIYNVPNTGTSTLGNLSCGQIYDNGASVSIGTPLTNANTLTYNTTGLAVSTSGVDQTGNLKLYINGITQGVAFLSSSDRKFKKDIKSIENALEKVQKIEGKTYFWDIENNKDKNFDNGGHSGFIAQELEKVLPHLVATSENGEKAVNYMELMPYLVEAIKAQQNQIKEQQSQINELKEQLSNNFKAQNNDLIKFENTKIINVSPNPSNDVISVSLNIEKGIQSAKLLVHDLNGTVLSSLNINERDTNIAKTLQKDNFGKGIYIIDLVINGKSIDTKKIVFN